MAVIIMGLGYIFVQTQNSVEEHIEKSVTSTIQHIGIVEMCERTLAAHICFVFSQVIVHHSSLYTPVSSRETVPAGFIQLLYKMQAVQIEALSIEEQLGDPTCYRKVPQCVKKRNVTFLCLEQCFISCYFNNLAIVVYWNLVQ